jgi:hypothetical protein
MRVLGSIAEQIREGEGIERSIIRTADGKMRGSHSACAAETAV